MSHQKKTWRWVKESRSDIHVQYRYLLYTYIYIYSFNHGWNHEIYISPMDHTSKDCMFSWLLNSFLESCPWNFYDKKRHPEVHGFLFGDESCCVMAWCLSCWLDLLQICRDWILSQTHDLVNGCCRQAECDLKISIGSYTNCESSNVISNSCHLRISTVYDCSRKTLALNP